MKAIEEGASLNQIVEKALVYYVNLEKAESHS